MAEFILTGLELETDRLILKVLDPSFADLVLDYYVRNQEFLSEWEPARAEDFYTRAYHETILNSELDKMHNDQLFRVWVFPKSDGLTKIIGTIGLNNIVRGAFLSCHVGYKLDKDYINQGYMTEALQGVIDFAFSSLGLHRLEANIIPRNQRSLQVVKKLGFYDEGLAKKYLRINGKWEDHIHMVLLNENME